MRLSMIFLLGFIFQQCNVPKKMEKEMKKDQVDVQGHRGCRGLMPENSIPAFLKALELGVTTLEMDVVISGDHQVIVSHDPFFSHKFCKDAMGKEIVESDERNHLIYQMSLSDIQKYDCGTRVNPQFPSQVKIKTYKPTLEEVFDVVERWIEKHELPLVQYNIEIKRDPEYDGINHPGPEEFVTLVLGVIHRHDMGKRVIIQSFDPESLQIVREADPTIKLAFLVYENSIDENMKRLSFTPQIYSPLFELVDKDLVSKAHSDTMKVIPWTVNNPDHITKMLDLGVDGIISDYPDVVLKIIAERRRI